MLWKCCTQYASKFKKCSSGHGTGKGQFSFQSQRKAMPKNIQTTTQLHSSHMQASNAQNSSSQASTVCELWTSDVQSGFRKGKGTWDQIVNIYWIMEKVRGLQINHLLLLYWLGQSLWLCGSQQTVENSERDANTRLPDLPPEKSVCRSRRNS